MTLSSWCRSACLLALSPIACTAFLHSNSAVHAADKEAVAISVRNSDGKGAAVVARLAKRIWQRGGIALCL
jgi:hypothetical protein